MPFQPELGQIHSPKPTTEEGNGISVKNLIKPGTALGLGSGFYLWCTWLCGEGVNN